MNTNTRYYSSSVPRVYHGAIFEGKPPTKDKKMNPLLILGYLKYLWKVSKNWSALAGLLLIPAKHSREEAQPLYTRSRKCTLFVPHHTNTCLKYPWLQSLFTFVVFKFNQLKKKLKIQVIISNKNQSISYEIVQLKNKCFSTAVQQMTRTGCPVFPKDFLVKCKSHYMKISHQLVIY